MQKYQNDNNSKNLVLQFMFHGPYNINYICLQKNKNISFKKFPKDFCDSTEIKKKRFHKIQT